MLADVHQNGWMQYRIAKKNRIFLLIRLLLYKRLRFHISNYTRKNVVSLMYKFRHLTVFSSTCIYFVNGRTQLISDLTDI